MKVWVAGSGALNPPQPPPMDWRGCSISLERTLGSPPCKCFSAVCKQTCGQSAFGFHRRRPGSAVRKHLAASRSGGRSWIWNHLWRESLLVTWCVLRIDFRTVLNRFLSGPDLLIHLRPPSQPARFLFSPLNLSSLPCLHPLQTRGNANYGCMLIDLINRFMILYFPEKLNFEICVRNTLCNP